MLIKRPADINPSEITPQDFYRRRREFMASAGVIAAAGFLPAGATAQSGGKLSGSIRKSAFSTTEKANTFKEVSSYNNFYEFGTDKDDPAQLAGRFRPRPWTVKVSGEVKKPRTFGIEELLKFPLEERIYRMRCVEAWSMVIPWVGFEFNHIARLVEPTANAKSNQA